MKIVALDVSVIGDGQDIDPDTGGVEPLACVRVRTDDGLEGVAEVFRVPPGVVRATVGGPETHFGRLLLGQELTHPERLWQRMWDALIHTNRRGWQVIILGALDVALWDLYGQSLGRPVYELLGGEQRGPFQTHAETPRGVVVPYATLVSDSWGGEAMVRQQVDRAERLAAAGWRAFKAEPMMSAPGMVVELARRVREAIGPGRTLMVDVGYGFHDVPTAARVSRQLAALDVFFFETPLPVDVPEAYARLAAVSPVPLAMGEHGVTRWEFRDMLDRGGVQVVQPYATTCGGLTEAKRIVEMARARGALVCPGNWSTALLGAANAHLAAYSPITPFVEMAPAEALASPLRRALQDALLPVADGLLTPPPRPGLGIDVPEEIWRRFAA